MGRFSVAAGHKSREFLFDLPEIGKPLKLEEQLLGEAIEVLHTPIAPGMPLWNKQHLHSQMQAQADHPAKGSGGFVASPKLQPVVPLKNGRNPQRLKDLKEKAYPRWGSPILEGIPRNGQGGPLFKHLEIALGGLVGKIPRTNQV